MQEIIVYCLDHLYSLALGLGVIWALIFKKPATAAKLNKIRQNKIEKYKEKNLKMVKKMQSNEQKIEILEKEQNKNA